MKRLGTQTIQFDNPPTILSTASIVGPKEAQGPLAKYFDQCLDDEFWGEKLGKKQKVRLLKKLLVWQLLNLE